MFVLGKPEVLDFMHEHGITVEYQKVRTKLFNEQRKEQQRIRKALRFA